MRVVHQTRPPVASSVTRSPSRVSFPRNSATAALACCAVAALRWTSSKTITKVRPRRSSSPAFVETLGGEGRAGDAAAAAAVTGAAAPGRGRGSRSSAARRPRAPRRSPSRRSVTGSPFPSVTTTSTVTCSTRAGKVGVGPGTLRASCGLAGRREGDEEPEACDQPLSIHGPHHRRLLAASSPYPGPPGSDRCAAEQVPVAWHRFRPPRDSGRAVPHRRKRTVKARKG